MTEHGTHLLLSHPMSILSITSGIFPLVILDATSDAGGLGHR